VNIDSAAVAGRRGTVQGTDALINAGCHNGAWVRGAWSEQVAPCSTARRPMRSRCTPKRAAVQRRSARVVRGRADFAEPLPHDRPQVRVQDRAGDGRPAARHYGPQPLRPDYDITKLSRRGAFARPRSEAGVLQDDGCCKASRPLPRCTWKRWSPNEAEGDGAFRAALRRSVQSNGCEKGQG